VAIAMALDAPEAGARVGWGILHGVLVQTPDASPSDQAPQAIDLTRVATDLLGIVRGGRGSEEGG
jgi:hypothetical protein